MSDLLCLTDVQMACVEPSFQSPNSTPADDRRVVSDILFINRNGLRRRDVPVVYGPHKKLCNRWQLWDYKGAFARTKAGLTEEHGEMKAAIIDATCPKAHCIATSMDAQEGGVDT